MKKKCLTLLAILIIIKICLTLIVLTKHAISFQVHLLIFFVHVFPPMLFLYYKLLVVVRKSRSDRGVSPEMKKTFSLKNISSCLLALACHVTISIPALVFVGLRMNYTQARLSLDHHVHLIAIWSGTIASMNPTFNCLIFYWKNKVLRTYEGFELSLTNRPSKQTFKRGCHDISLVTKLLLCLWALLNLDFICGNLFNFIYRHFSIKKIL